MSKELTRMWIDQPSMSQPFHHLNGTNVLAQHEYDDTMRIYFLEGDVVSQQIPRLALSKGWLKGTPVSTDPNGELSEEQRNQAFFMNLATGAVDTYENRVANKHNWGPYAEAHLKSLIRVTKNSDGDWIDAQGYCAASPNYVANHGVQRTSMRNSG